MLDERSCVGWEKSRELGALRISSQWWEIQLLLKYLRSVSCIILIVNEAKVIWRSSEVSHKLSKEAVRGLMLSLLPLPISLVTLILNNLILESISLKGLQHFGVLYRSMWCELGRRAPIDSVWQLDFDYSRSILCILTLQSFLTGRCWLLNWRRPSNEKRRVGRKATLGLSNAEHVGSVEKLCGTVWHIVDGLGRLVFVKVWLGLAWHCSTGCRSFDGSRAEGFPRGGQVCQRGVFFKACSRCQLVHDAWWEELCRLREEPWTWCITHFMSVMGNSVVTEVLAKC